LGFLLPNLLILSFVFYYSKKFFSWKKGSFISEFVFFSIPLSLVSIFLALIGYMDTIFLGALTDISEVAFYNVALPTAHLLFIFSTSLLALFLPLVTEKYAKNQNLKGDYMSVTKWIFMSTLPFSLIMILFSDNILWILFGQKYLSASITLSILAFSFFINSLAQPSKHILIMLKKSKLILVLVCVAFSLNILLNIILIPFFDKNYAHGMYGAALSTMISLFFLALSNLIFAYKNTKIFLFNKTHIKISLAAFMSTLIVYFIQKMFIVQSIWHLISFLIIYLFLYVFLIFYLKILEEHDKIVLGALKKRITSLVPSFLIRD
jgi:O-antigen/teichoic acid export membrane protein